jgi:hypothetical protein
MEQSDALRLTQIMADSRKAGSLDIEALKQATA